MPYLRPPQKKKTTAKTTMKSGYPMDFQVKNEENMTEIDMQTWDPEQSGFRCHVILSQIYRNFPFQTQVPA